MNITSWLGWAAVLFFQNISFTYVSRARSSGSLARHLKASIFSNGIWIFSNMLMLGPMFDYLTGKHGVLLQVVSGAVYTVSCVSGSLTAHFLALKTEKGKNAVGYNKKYAQIPVEEWERVKALMEPPKYMFPNDIDWSKYNVNVPPRTFLPLGEPIESNPAGCCVPTTVAKTVCQADGQAGQNDSDRNS